MKRKYSLCLFILVAFTAGLMAPEAGLAAEAKKFTSSTTDKLRWHVPMVTAAFFQRLRGVDPAAIAKAVKVKGAKVIVPEMGFKFEGFQIGKTQIISLAKLEDKDADFRYLGRLSLVDPLGRETVVAFMMDYKLGDKEATIVRANWTPLFPKTPHTRALVVRKDDVKDIIKDSGQTYAGMYALAVGAAVPMQSKDAISDKEGDYVIMVFVMDRIAPDATFEVKISKFRKGNEGFKDDTRYKIYDGGWPVALIPGAFKISSENEFFVKALYKPGRHVSRNLEGEKRIGLWSTVPK